MENIQTSSNRPAPFFGSPFKNQALLFIQSLTDSSFPKRKRRCGKTEETLLNSASPLAQTSQSVNSKFVNSDLHPFSIPMPSELINPQQHFEPDTSIRPYKPYLIPLPLSKTASSQNGDINLKRQCPRGLSTCQIAIAPQGNETDSQKRE